jgi:hypothetical protein
MVIEVSYKTNKDAADPNCHFTRSELFESRALPDKKTISEKLSSMGKDFAEDIILISASNADAEILRKSGLRVIKL